MFDSFSEKIQPAKPVGIQFHLVDSNDSEQTIHFEKHQFSDALKAFTGRFQQESTLKLIKIRNGEVQQSYTAEDAHHQYEKYPFAQLDGINDSAYERLKIGFVYAQMFDFFIQPYSHMKGE